MNKLTENLTPAYSGKPRDTGLHNPSDGGLTVTSLRDLLSRDFSEEPIVSNGILGPGRSLLILGQPKSGKTMLALNLAVSLATGTDWLGFEIPERQRILYLSGEGGPQLLKDRVSKMISAIDTTPDDIFFWWPDEKFLRLDEPESTEQIIGTIQEKEITVVIFDPLIHFHTIDENSSKEMSKLLSMFAHIRRRTNVATVIVHHSRKPGAGSHSGSVNEARGSSVLHGDVDGSIVLSQQKSKKEFILHFDLRWAEAPESLYLQLDPDQLLFSVEGKVRNKRAESKTQRYLDTLSDGRERTASELSLELDRDKTTVLRHLKKLEKSGKVKRRTDKNKTYFWSLTEKNEDFFDEDE